MSQSEVRSCIDPQHESIRRHAERKGQEQFARSLGSLSADYQKPEQQHVDGLGSKSSYSRTKSHPLDGKTQFSSQSEKIAQTVSNSSRAEADAEERGIQPAPYPTPANSLNMTPSAGLYSTPTCKAG